MERRTFTPEEADRTLPLVRGVVEDIVRTYTELSTLAGEYKLAWSSAPQRPDHEEHLAATKRFMSALSDEIDGYVVELEEIGCEVKDLGSGIVDFPTELEGRSVLLCWQRGEERVEHWHEMTDGFAGRKRLPLGVRS